MYAVAGHGVHDSWQIVQNHVPNVMVLKPF